MAAIDFLTSENVKLQDRIRYAVRFQNMPDKTGEYARAFLAGNSVSESKKSKGHAVAVVSSVGDSIRSVLESHLGRKLTCQDCLGYLSRLNTQTSHSHDDIVKYLSANFPFPIEWREANPDRAAAISSLIEPIVPKIYPVESGVQPTPGKTQFVWLYMDDKKHSDDLKLSMLSIHKFFKGEYEFVVVGDVPSWYVGKSIRIPMVSLSEARKVTQSLARHRYVDTMLKMKHACQSGELEENFIWMMDDQVFIRDFNASFFDLRMFDEHKPGVRVWEKLVRSSMDFLNPESPKHFGTHFPQRFNCQKMLECYARFDMPRKLFLFDVAYGNYVQDDTVRYNGRGRRVVGVAHKKMNRLAELSVAEETVINWNDQASVDPLFRQFLKERVCSGTKEFGQLPFASTMQISWL